MWMGKCKSLDRKRMKYFGKERLGLGEIRRVCYESNLCEGLDGYMKEWEELKL